VSDIDPTDLTVVGRRPVPEKFSQDLSVDAPPAGASHGKPEREGLPPGYRMRADAHYVELLASRRPERDARIGAHAEPEADAAGDVRDRRSERVLAQLHEELAAITAAANLLATDGAPLVRRLSVDLIRAQAWRASWLLRAHALLDATQRAQTRTRPLASVLEQLRQGLTPECRLAGVALQIQASDWNAIVAIDEPAFIAGATGAVVATLGLIGHTEGAVIRLAVEASGGELRSLDVTQDEVAVVPATVLRFFDLSWTDRPGGFAAALGAMSARSAAQQHGGTATIVAGERRGTTLRLSLARTH
jgi:hypothetical protein